MQIEDDSRTALANAARARESTRIVYAFRALALLIGVWLAYSLVVVNVEFDDGYATIINSQYFLGIPGDYLWSRAPMLAWLLMPAEAVANALHLHPLDVRPHHVIVVAAHFGYLFAVWHILRRRFGATLPVLIAFVAAIPTVVYFCYAPFISHDLIPGLVALVMVVLADQYATQPSRKTWLALVALGAAVALVKHMHGAIWLAILLAYFALAMIDRHRSWRLLFNLSAAAATSAIIFWFLYAWVLTDSFPDVGLLYRPLWQMQAVVRGFQSEGPISSIIYQWVYLKNLSIYGILAMSLVLPGLYFSRRDGDRLQRSAAIVWIVLFVIINAVSFKEARYLAVLAPLTALVIVPAISQLIRWRPVHLAPILLVLLVDLGFGAREALRIRQPFYHDQVKEFLTALPLASELKAPVFMTRYLSFVSPDSYAFYGDRYHRIINLNSDQVRLLYGYPSTLMRFLADVRALTSNMLVPAGTVIFANDVAARVLPIAADNRTTLQDTFVQFVATVETLALTRVGDDYRWGGNSSQPMVLLRADGQNAEPLTSFDHYSVAETIASQGLSDAPQQLRVYGLRVSTLCNISGCRSF